MSWTKLNQATVGKRHYRRALPPETTGRKPLPSGYGINKGLLDAACNFWRIKKGFVDDPSPWEKSGRARAC